MNTSRTFTIETSPPSADRSLGRDAVVCIDVISTSTAVVTAVSRGRKVVPAASVEEARFLADGFDDALLAVDGPGPRRAGEVAASPIALSRLDHDHSRPLVIAGTFGTRFLVRSGGARAVYVASLRNLAATARHLAGHHRRVALLGTGADGEFRCEDRMAVARLGSALLHAGFSCEDAGTEGLVQRWAEIDLGVMRLGKSAAELRRDHRKDDLRFVLQHVDDLDLVCRYRDGRMTAVSSPEVWRDVGPHAVPAAVLASVLGAGRAQISAS